MELRYVGTRGISLPAQIRRNASQVPSDNLFLPTFFNTSDVPTNVSSTAPSLADFQNAAVRPYAADGFVSNITAFDPAASSTYHGGPAQVTCRLSAPRGGADSGFVRSRYSLSPAAARST